MDGQAIAAAPPGSAGRRLLPTEIVGPRPGGTPAQAAVPGRREIAVDGEARVARPART